MDISSVEIDTEIFLRLAESKRHEDWRRAVDLYHGGLFFDTLYEWAYQYEGFYAVRYQSLVERPCDYYASVGDTIKKDYYFRLTDEAGE